MTDSIQREGQIEPHGFAGLLRRLVSELAEGRLEVTAGGVSRRLWLEAGQVCAVASSEEDEKLGTWLVKRGVLDGTQMAVALLRQPEGVRFGTFLVMEKLLAYERLVAELAKLSVTIVSRLLLMEGSFVFVPQERLPRDAVTLDLSTASLLVAAVRAVADPESLQPLVPADLYLWSAQDALLRYQNVRLAPQEAYLLSRIDGQATRAVLGRIVSVPKGELTRGLAALIAAGLVETRSEPMPRQQAAPATSQAPAGAELPASHGFEMVAGPRAPAQPVAPPPAEERVDFTPEQELEHSEILRLASSVHRLSPWQRLGLVAGTDKETVAIRYRDLVRRYHPDRVNEPHLAMLRRELGDIAVALREAYEKITGRRTGDPSDIEASAPARTWSPPPSPVAQRMASAAPPAQRSAAPAVTQQGPPPPAAHPSPPKPASPQGPPQPAAPQSPPQPALPPSPPPPASHEAPAPSTPVVFQHPPLPAQQGGGSGPVRGVPQQDDEARRVAVQDKVRHARRLLRDGDPAQATELLDHVVRLASDPKTLLFLARVEFENPIWVARGLDHLRHAVSMDPKFTEGWLELASYWGARGQTDKRRQCLEKILSYDPRNESVRAALSSLAGSPRAR